MNIYHFLETVLIVLIGVFSAYHVLKLLMPQAMHGVRVRIAERLSHSRRDSWRHVVATKLRDAAPSNGCGTGCADGCDGCHVSARIHPKLARDDDSSL